ncbi:putative DNA modification/repair radical SAM protein [Clostridium aminobutyricum]|uniref:DNA modification/repair radical SAM protein n=1 Tax=Clostridium aminobutyricum TaxID=33953 RepID=A0A939D9H1_CLOAM|nr:putative DNA modification/repair radical SAM protein [Clostridium aminobutyricum]MBN7773178.1 putative DNA modification/repair radical SAM protein [Clostridium aminobutyricum]
MEKLKILADSAKYDVSCSSSGAERKNTGKLGNVFASGICHSWSADGRCISLLKVLFTNKCVYDCQYCVNRRSVETERASFEPQELADLTMEFYRRNYIEGLFLSSAVEVSPDYTAERILKCLTMLRYEYGFAGYIHAKIIPGVSKELLHAIGMVADRLSVNIELPTEESLQRLAPQKKPRAIFVPMKQITNTLIEQKSLKGPGTMFKGQNLNSNLNYLEPEGKNITMGDGSLADLTQGPYGKLQRSDGNTLIRETPFKYKEKFAPAGQTTQMIIGAGTETDRQIVKTSESLYRTFKMKRVYFSAYIPVSDSPLLPSVFNAPPLRREHRLYQADWLLRFYGFQAEEMFNDENPNLDLELDPKITWALRNIERFPVEVNKASMEELLRIPGVGTISALRIVRQRKVAAVKYEDLKKMGVVLKRASYFLTCSGKYYGGKDLIPEYIRGKALEAENIRNNLLPIDDEVQISMFTPGIFTPGLSTQSPKKGLDSTQGRLSGNKILPNIKAGEQHGLLI